MWSREWSRAVGRLWQKPLLCVGAWSAIGGLGLWAAPPVGALSVSPTVVELRLAVGATAQGAFQVVNDTQSPVTLSVEVESLAPASYAPLSPDQWLQVSPATLTLAPRQQAEVAYVVVVPHDLSGELAAEVVFVQHVSSGSATGLQVRFGMAVYISIAGTERLQLKAGSLRLQNGQPPTVLIPLTNDGNVHCRPEGSVVVRNGHGEILAHGTLTRGMPAPPRRVEHFTIRLAAPVFAPGMYQVTADLTCYATAEPPAHVIVETTGELSPDGQWTLNPS